MARGIRKRGQFLVKVWFPDGAIYEEKSIRNLTDVEFREMVQEVFARIQKGLPKVANYRPNVGGDDGF